MKHLVFFNSNKVWGGGEKWHFEMSMALKLKGFEITLVTNPASELFIKAQEAGLNCIELEVGNFSFINPFKKAQLRRILKLINPHAIFMNLPSDVKICAPIANKLNIPHVIYRRGMPNILKKSLINNYTYKSVSKFIANSHEIKSSLIKNFPEFDQKVEVVFNGVKETFKNKKNPSDKFIIGHLGRLVDQKGFSYLIEIAEILKKNEVNFKVLIGGKGPLEEQLKGLVTQKKLNNHIDFLGHIRADDFFHCIDLFAFTSKFEGSANALIESIAYEVPAIAFNTSSMPEVIEDGVEGFLVDPFDTKMFANKVMQIINSSELRQSFKENTHKKLIKNFLYENKVNQVMEMIK